MLGKSKQELPPMDYHHHFRFQIRVSQAMLWIGLALAIIGPAMSPFFYAVHGSTMLAALTLFYMGIMYSQHPGFTNFMPSKQASILIASLLMLWGALLMASNWTWRPLTVLWASIYAIMFAKQGLGGKPLYFPNWFTLAGLLSDVGAAVLGFQWGLIGFPIASAMGLVRRVSNRMKPTPLDALLLPLYPIVASLLWLEADRAAFIAIIIALMGLPIVNANEGLAVALPMGLIVGLTVGLPSAIATILMGLPSIYYFHAMAIGFLAPIMLSLCVPMLAPGILWIWPKGYSSWIPAAVGAAAVLRILSYYYGEDALIGALLLLYIAVIGAAQHYIRGRRVKVL
ncbi:hypothetical protein GCM10007981_19270 [Thermocladium modestius]|uniref:Uncharacterized protein n=1 Tax=Thermocladium modestius TaxID=62609 RepID=A0A830GYY0_9CREN|nr:hypothetical protein [Thermocladium modestius]GGP22590.1 hypothetical protein GCM10007981_19270 [Thermocladium modestius]